MNLFSVLFSLFSLVNFTPHAGFGHYAVIRPLDTVGGGLPHTAATPPPSATAAPALIKPLDTVGGGLPHTVTTPAPTLTMASSVALPADTIGGGLPGK